MKNHFKSPLSSKKFNSFTDQVKRKEADPCKIICGWRIKSALGGIETLSFLILVLFVSEYGMRHQKIDNIPIFRLYFISCA